MSDGLDEVRRAGSRRRTALADADADADEAIRELHHALIEAHRQGATYYRLAQVSGITQAAVRKIVRAGGSDG